MAHGKRYTKEEWESAIALRKLGKTEHAIADILGRPHTHIVKAINQYGGDYDAYAKGWKKKGKRTTEQLQFIPPEMPKAPKKIYVKGIDETCLTAHKLRAARIQAIAIRHFIEELQDAGYRIKLG